MIETVRLLIAVLVTAATSCTNEVEEPSGAIINEWTVRPPPSDKSLPGLDEIALYERVSRRLEERFVLPRDLRVVHLACGEPNAFYDPPKARIRMCDELLEKVAAVTRTNTEKSEEDVLMRVHSTWVLMFLHEVGHAFIDMFDLPVLGNEEDAVDRFAALLLINAGEATMAQLAFDYYAALDTAPREAKQFADEHGLDLQRYYVGLCIVYGSDPELHAEIVEQGLLSRERAARCVPEYRKLLSDWTMLLGSRLRPEP
jgi:hypothetical protein